MVSFHGARSTILETSEEKKEALTSYPAVNPTTTVPTSHKIHSLVHQCITEMHVT